MTTISEMTQAEIVARMQVRGLDLNVQAGVEVLRGVGNGSVFEWPAVREHLVERDGALFMQWRALSDAVDNGDPGLVYLSTTGHRALDLAIGLALNRPVRDLGSILCGFDHGNARVVLDALAIALHLSVVAADPDYR